MVYNYRYGRDESATANAADPTTAADGRTGDGWRGRGYHSTADERK